MSGLEIFNISAPDASRQIQAFEAFGFERIAGQILRNTVSSIAVLGRDALRTTIPVRTTELRRNIVIDGFGESPGADAASDGFGRILQKTVSIKNGLHESSSTRFPINNVVLAEILDSGESGLTPPHTPETYGKRYRVKSRVTTKRNLSRTQNAIAQPPFGDAPSAGVTTGDFIGMAQRMLVSRLGALGG